MWAHVHEINILHRTIYVFLGWEFKCSLFFDSVYYVASWVQQENVASQTPAVTVASTMIGLDEPKLYTFTISNFNPKRSLPVYECCITSKLATHCRSLTAQLSVILCWESTPISVRITVTSKSLHELFHIITHWANL